MPRSSGRNTKYRCNICQKNLSHRNALTKHLRIHRGAYAVYCHICQKGFMDRSLLNGHLANKHQAAEKQFTCRYCDKRYAYKGQLTEHIKLKHTS